MKDEIEVIRGLEPERAVERLSVGAFTIDADSPVFGAVDSAVLHKDEQGNWELKVYGWLTGVKEHPVLLQLAVPGSQFVLPERMERPDIGEQLRTLPGARNSGFVAHLPLRRKVSGAIDLHFLVTLHDGLTLAGVLSAWVNDAPAEEERIAPAAGGARDDGDYQKLIAARDRNLRTELASFLRGKGLLDFTRPRPPCVSVIIPLFNRAELTLACVRSLAAVETPDIELILIDNGSSDDTKALLAKLRGVQSSENSSNRHYLEASNQGAAQAKGEYLLFLNNDATLLPEPLGAALAAFGAGNEVGAVGGRVIRPDGTLQEAGSLVWSDGSTMGYGVGDDPGLWRYLYRRDVDYCSGVFLLTPRRLFEELGGFDIAYRPAYYEDADYCVRLHERGRRVIY